MHYREDKKLKMDVVKQQFNKHLVEGQWKCKQNQLRCVEVEELKGEVIIRMFLKLSSQALSQVVESAR